MTKFISVILGFVLRSEMLVASHEAVLREYSDPSTARRMFMPPLFAARRGRI